MNKFEIFLKEINDLEQKHGVHLGDFFHFEDAPDEVEIWDGKRKERLSISSDYGHYVVASRPFDDTDAGAELEHQVDAGAELEGDPDPRDAGELEGDPDPCRRARGECLRILGEAPGRPSSPVMGSTTVAGELDEIDTRDSPHSHIFPPLIIQNIDKRIRVIEAVLLGFATHCIGKSKVGKILSIIDKK
jgi:hypothetical protein